MVKMDILFMKEKNGVYVKVPKRFTMKEEEIIKEIEDEITNLEGMKYHFNIRLDDAIERIKKLRFQLKYPNAGITKEFIKNVEEEMPRYKFFMKKKC